MIEKSKMLLSYVKANVGPILEGFIFGDDIEGAVVLPANIDKSELNGHYEGEDFLAPKWFNDISKDGSILVIDKLDTIPEEEQLKFYELLKYRKVSTFELPNNCVIIVTVSKVKKINKEILSLVVRI